MLRKASWQDPTIISWTPQKNRQLKEETNKLNYIKIKTNYVSEGTTVKMQPKKWGKKLQI